MIKRKKMLIDAKFQLKHTGFIVGIFSLIVVIMIGITGTAVYINNQKLEIIAEQQQGLTNSQKEIMKSLQVFSRNKTWQNLHLAIGKASRDMDKVQQKIEQNITLTNEITLFNNGLLIAILALFLLMNIALSILFVRRLHRISGPIYVLTNYFKNMLKGDYPEVKPLRKNDEFKKLFELFSQVTTRLKEQEERRKAGAKVKSKIKAKTPVKKVTRVKGKTVPKTIKKTTSKSKTKQ